ncbi:MAG: di-trans,poly-cis-decaprenylcistransferase [Gammaproteobacteria bacterium]|nr:di-trans,poly-cis-decaprenylcistransferase [Gammaproteobacteria bacterium]
MDGNGRWAKERGLVRMRGHKEGANAARRIINYCVEKKISSLTLWAFGIENWGRPRLEVRYLMELFYRALNNNLKAINQNKIKLQVIGRRDNLEPKLISIINKVENATRDNSGLKLNIAFNYSGKWDVLNATRQIVRANIDPDAIDENMFRSFLSLPDQVDPDLFIRTSGELRLSNFLLWQLAYTEFYFTETYWPDFDETGLEKAISEFNSRDRRFGRVK